MLVRTTLLGALALTFACVPPQSPEPPVGEDEELGARLENLNDGQIAQIAIAIDAGQLHLASLALNTAEDPEVIALAEMLIRDHAESSQQLRDLVIDGDLEFRDTEFGDELERKFQADRESIDHLRGEQFERAYVRLVIEAHRDAIDLVEDHLQPAADLGELERHLERQLPMLTEHLSEARRVDVRLRPRG